jgi:iron complex outermembrane receptor protein
MSTPSRPLAALVTVACLFEAQAQERASPAADTGTQTAAPVFVTASPLGSTLFDLVDPVNLLQGRELQLRQQPTLGGTLQQEVGVSGTYFGPNASRPVIRGFGGFDIRLLNNGIGLLDASAASPDHAVAMSPYAVERIEVVRGPATVLYGGSAIGGVVNTIDSRIAERPPAEPFAGAASYGYDSVSGLNAGGARLDVGNDRFALHGDFHASNNGDLRIPGPAWTGGVQADRGEPGPSGRLPNSAGDSQSWGLGATAFVGDRAQVGVSYGRFDTDYGTVAEPGVTIRLGQQAWNVAGEWRTPIDGLSALRFKYGYNDYTHTEYEEGEAGTRFDSSGWNLRLEGSHGARGSLQGTFGVEFANVDFAALGAEAFVPTTRTKNGAVFVVEELPLDDWKFTLGGRIGSDEVSARPFTATGQPADTRRFTPWSAALGALYAPGRAWNIGANLQYTQRAPSAQELYANGPHLATDQFEVGNRDLGKVASTAIDVSFKQRSGGYASGLSLFYAAFSNYVALLPTGIWRNPEDRSVVPGPAPIPDPGGGDPVLPMQQFDYTGVRARFWGAEAQVELPLWGAGAQSWSTRLQADYVNATDLSNDQPLPYIPPLRFGVALNYRHEAFEASLGGLFAARQSRVPDTLTATPGYASVYLNATYRRDLGAGTALEFYLQATNLLDQTIRFATSTLKDIAPAGARAVAAGVRASF